MERVIVTGSNSFSGSHFVDYALEYGAEVIGISRSPEPNPVFLPYKKRQNPSFWVFIGRISIKTCRESWKF